MVEPHVITKYDRGFDRRPTPEEWNAPPDKRPWTEYDKNGSNQDRPDYKACPLYCPLIICPVGCVCLICELEWPEFCGCGDNGDLCCDVCCRCRCGRLPVCICCGPQLNNVCPDYCCYAESCFQRQCASARVGAKESCCDCCDCCYQMFAPRYAGCKTLCCHCTCVGCPAGCENCCCCQEERLMMDGDLQIIPTGGSGDVPLSDATEST
uniref:Uncharacterized protein n=1 Tax=Aureoumbra lagunensis TaxID=44058 RepID=A0A7S3K205_9STRA|mmetsp:Transcript_4054/g.5688  ORF Transcript_4054/g.5688 Transcript_4054/m.5688 type:complete len:209 (+) Transcript_4054:115-741(+)